MIQDQGLGFCQDPRRREALLRDHCPDCKREFFVLMGALQCGVGSALLDNVMQLPIPLLQERLAARLEQDLAITPEAARWGGACWAGALERVAPTPPTTGHAFHPPAGRRGEPSLPPATQRLARRCGYSLWAGARVLAKYLISGFALAYGAFILLALSDSNPQTPSPAAVAPGPP